MPSWMEAFEQRGLEAVTTASPARALHQWQTDIPLLTVVDLSLPLADSLAICRIGILRFSNCSSTVPF